MASSIKPAASEETFTSISNRLDPIVERIKTLTGSCVEAIDRFSPSFRNPLLLDLGQKIKDSQSSYKEAEEKLENFLLEFKQVHDSFDEFYEAYEYLNNGFGQYEEYEHNINEESEDFQSECDHIAKFTKEAKRQVLSIDQPGDIEAITSVFQDLDNLIKKFLDLGKRLIESSSYLPFEKERLCHSIDQTVIEFNDTVSRGAEFLPHVKIKNQTWETSQDGLEYFAGYMQGLSDLTKHEVEFEKKCAKSRFIQTIEEEASGCGDDLDSFSEAFTTAWENLEIFFKHIRSHDYDAALDQNLVENIEDDLRSLAGITEAIASALDTARSDYMTTYDNPGNPGCYAMLEEPEAQWYQLCSNCEQLLRWFGESCQSLEILADATSSKKLLLDGIELLRKLPNGKKTRGKKDLRAADSDASLDDSVESITEIINLIRKAVLELPEEGKNLEELRRLREEQKNIILENKQPSDDNLIDDYINYYRTNTKILKIEETQRQMAAAFASVVSEQDIQTEKSVVYVQVKGKEPSSYRRLSVDIQSPLDSALVELISVTCKEEMRYSNLGTFLDLTQRTITKFEKGLLKTLGKSVDRTVCRHESFVSDAASSDSKNGYLENKIAEHPDYYSIFSLEQSSLPEVHVTGFDAELESIYGLFTILLAYHFADDANRKDKKLPSGHPIASLVVSEHGKILAWAINTIGSKPIDPIRHAEVNAIKSYFIQNPTQKKLPAGTRIFTSLKSCHMCAGAIEDSKGDGVRVIYGLDELSKNINNTEINGYEAQISSDIVKQMDGKYREIKNQKTHLNAGQALMDELMKPFAQQILNAICQFENEEVLGYLQKFYQHCTGELLISDDLLAINGCVI